MSPEADCDAEGCHCLIFTPVLREHRDRAFQQAMTLTPDVTTSNENYHHAALVYLVGHNIQCIHFTTYSNQLLVEVH